jgi:extracellular elastinolytic metalloproteinase
MPVDAQTPASARALAHLRAHAPSLGVAPADLADLVVTNEAVSRQTGVTHVYVRQRFRAVEIIGADVTVSIAPDGTITHQAGSLVANLAAAANRPRSTLQKQDAVGRAARHAGLTLPEDERNVRPARRVYHPVAAGKLRLAWQVEIETPDGEHLWVITIDAVSGALLDKFDRIVSRPEATARPPMTFVPTSTTPRGRLAPA